MKRGGLIVKVLFLGFLALGISQFLNSNPTVAEVENLASDPYGFWGGEVRVSQRDRDLTGASGYMRLWKVFVNDKKRIIFLAGFLYAEGGPKLFLYDAKRQEIITDYEKEFGPIPEGFEIFCEVPGFNCIKKSDGKPVDHVDYYGWTGGYEFYAVYLQTAGYWELFSFPQVQDNAFRNPSQEDTIEFKYRLQTKKLNVLFDTPEEAGMGAAAKVYEQQYLKHPFLKKWWDRNFDWFIPLGDKRVLSYIELSGRNRDCFMPTSVYFILFDKAGRKQRQFMILHSDPRDPQIESQPDVIKYCSPYNFYGVRHTPANLWRTDSLGGLGIFDLGDGTFLMWLGSLDQTGFYLRFRGEDFSTDYNLEEHNLFIRDPKDVIDCVSRLFEQAERIFPRGKDEFDRKAIYPAFDYVDKGITNFVRKAICE